MSAAASSRKRAFFPTDSTSVIRRAGAAMRSARPGNPAPLPTSITRSRPVHRRAPNAVHESRKCLCAISAGVVIAVRFTVVLRSVRISAKRSQTASCSVVRVRPNRAASSRSAANGGDATGIAGIVSARMARAVRLFVVAAALLVLGCASAAEAADAALSGTVQIVGFKFVPASVTINIGDSVTWTNADAVLHSAKSTTGAFDTGAIGEGNSKSIAFNTPGTFPYVCGFHPTLMSGEALLDGILASGRQ